MSAAELIRKMAELPPAERAIFEQLYGAMQKGAARASTIGEETAPRVSLQRKGVYLVAVTDCVITEATTRRALDEFP